MQNNVRDWPYIMGYYFLGIEAWSLANIHHDAQQAKLATLYFCTLFEWFEREDWPELWDEAHNLLIQMRSRDAG